MLVDRGHYLHGVKKLMASFYDPRIAALEVHKQDKHWETSSLCQLVDCLTQLIHWLR